MPMYTMIRTTNPVNNRQTTAHTASDYATEEKFYHNFYHVFNEIEYGTNHENATVNG